MDIQIKTEMPVTFLGEIHDDMVKLVLLNEHYWRCMFFFFPLTIPSHSKRQYGSLNQSCANKPGNKDDTSVMSVEE